MIRRQIIVDVKHQLVDFMEYRSSLNESGPYACSCVIPLVVLTEFVKHADEHTPTLCISLFCRCIGAMVEQYLLPLSQHRLQSTWLEFKCFVPYALGALCLKASANRMLTDPEYKLETLTEGMYFAKISKTEPRSHRP